MKKQLKIRAEFHWKLKDFFLTKILSEKYNLLRVQDNEDITIGLVEPTHLTKEFLKSPKKILVAGENLFYKINIFKFLEYFSKKTKINFGIINKIFPCKILDIKLGFLRKQYLSYIKKLSKYSPKGEYAIISNNIKGKNILNFPFFLQVKEIRDNLIKLKRKKINKKIPKNFCCLIISNESSFERIKFAKKLSKYKKVDIYGGTSLTNSDNNLLPKSWKDNYKFFSKYKFAIAFENSFEEEYITEKLPNVMLAGTIPIYRGPPNVSEYFNTKSFLNYSDYGKNYKKMIEKIIELDKDDKKYLKFLSQSWMNNQNKEKIVNKEKELEDFLNKLFSS